jgi:D-alanyl-lipoteichoic acid acyltransferase DltB (MBOAT superfamily)
VFWGLFKKTVIADNLAVLVDIVYAQDASPAPAEVLLATWAFALQIYCDFSGYTDIARGSARMLGFDLIRNFDLPYLATSVADFWRRWHISLSTWLRDYLYIPLGGNRKGSRRTELNLMLTMVLGGLWHGAAWNFVLWGAYHGVLLVVHRGLRPWLDRVRPANRVGRVTWHVIRVFFVFQAVSLGWLLFRAENAAHIASLLGVLAGPWSAGRAIGWLLPFAALATPLVLIQALQALTRDSEPLQRVPWLTRTASYSVLLCAWVVLGNDGGQPFIYFQF